MINVTIQEAKLRLPQLIKQAEGGETVRIFRKHVPIIELNAIKEKTTKKRTLGQHIDMFNIPESFFEPLPDDLLTLYNCE